MRSIRDLFCYFFAICKKQIRNLLHLWIDGCNEDAENDCNIDNYDDDVDKEEEEVKEEEEGEKDVSLRGNIISRP